MVDIIEWDSGHHLGQIPQVSDTYNTVGNTNEYGLIIGESTFGGISNLTTFEQPDAIMDYGSLMYITLQRAKNATEAIQVMADLVDKHGYHSTGESFSIADKKEVWVMEMIGKSNYTNVKTGAPEKGAVWVACKVPDGHVTAHANQARISTFMNNKDCIHSSDVVSFAKEHGFYPAEAKDEDFSFSGVYDPITFEGARACEIRTWSFFRSVVGADEMDQYIDYVSGKNLSNPMKWSYKPAEKVSVRRAMELLRDHLENTTFDFSQDIGAGPFNLPYRWRPLDWYVDGKHYVNERSTSTQQTSFVMVAQARSNVPDFMAVKNWFGLDDAACTVYAPTYGSNTEIASALEEKGNGDILDMQLSSSFWVFNLVANLAYTRWNLIYPEVRNMSDTLQDNYTELSLEAEEKAWKLYNESHVDQAIEYLTNFSKSVAQDLHDTWLAFWEYLVPRFLDGDFKQIINGTLTITNPGYGDAWYKRIVEDTGDRYLIPDEPTSSSQASSTSGSTTPSTWPAWKTAVIIVAGVVVVAIIAIIIVIVVFKRNRGMRAAYTSLDG